MTGLLFWVFIAYDALVVPPYFWVKVALGIATGFLIPGRVGLLACALGNAAIVSYAAFAAGRLSGLFSLNSTSLLSALTGLLMTSIILFIGVVWWFVGRIMRWAFYKIARAGS